MEQGVMIIGINENQTSAPLLKVICNEKFFAGFTCTTLGFIYAYFSGSLLKIVSPIVANCLSFDPNYYLFHRGLCQKILHLYSQIKKVPLTFNIMKRACKVLASKSMRMATCEFHTAIKNQIIHV
jgi:hypothetical protein